MIQPAGRVGGFLAKAVPACVRAIACERGHFALIFALAAPMVLTTAGWAVDYGIYSTLNSRAQAAADAAAVAGAKSLTMADASVENVSAVVGAVVRNYVGSGTAQGFAKSLQVGSQVSNTPGEPMQVSVKIEGPVGSLFVQKLGFGSWTLAVNSVAVVVGTPNICVLALDPSEVGTIYLEKEAKIVGQNCAIYSNSSHPNGIKAYDSSFMSANLICSAGGKYGSKGNFSPDPLVDCPHFSDPLEGRPAPAVSPCAANSLVVNNQTLDLWPGTYCGGLTITGSSVVKLKPGIYVMKDGPLIVDMTASMEGVGVGIYFSGQKSSFLFDRDSTISLTAPTDGVMAGILLFGDRSQSSVTYTIQSDHARQLLGTIYLPNGELSVDAGQPIADQSAYTAIVARKIRGRSGPTVTLNTRYEQTEVPVPTGIRGVGQGIALVK